MFEVGFDQAAGLRGQGKRGGPVLIPVASPTQPARAYELLCALAAHLTALGHPVVIVDGTATESNSGRINEGSHLGLLRALQDPSVAGLGRPADDADWLVLPSALGLQALQQTARASGPAVALSRLLSPFASGVILLLFAPATTLTGVLEGLQARPLVPMLVQPQATIDAYSALKELCAAGLSPVLMFQDTHDAVHQAPLQKTIATVQATALRHMGLAVDAWPYSQWGARVLEIALGRQQTSDSAQHHFTQPAGHSAAHPMFWS